MIKFIGIDGKQYSLDPNISKHPIRTREGCKSKLQYDCGQVIRKRFPLTPILEEIHIPNHNIIFDFFLPAFKMVFEIDGAQHEKYVPYFHKSKKGFLNSQIRDSNKEHLCKINNWTLYRVDSVDSLENLLEETNGPAND